MLPERLADIVIPAIAPHTETCKTMEIMASLYHSSFGSATHQLNVSGRYMRAFAQRLLRWCSLPTVCAVLGLALIPHASVLYSQGTVPDTLVPPEVEQGEMPPIVAQYESQPKTTNQYYTHSELAGGLSGLPTSRLRLVVNPDPTPDYCAPHEAVEGTLFTRLVLGLDDYTFGETELLVPFSLKVIIQGYDASNVAVGAPYECNLELTTLRPEQVCRFDVSNVLPNVAYFEVVSVAPYTFPAGTADINDHGIGVAATTYANLLNSLRLHVYYTERITIAAYQKDGVDPTKEDPNNPVILEVEGVGIDGGNNWVGVGALGEPITLSWDMPEGCEVDEYPSYQIQILRLFNHDPDRYPEGIDSDEKSIEETIDWRRALSFETGPLERDISGDQIREFTLTIAEGRGYYIWRVRPIGDKYPGGIANDRNWGKWSVAPQDEEVVDITGFGNAQATVNGGAMGVTMRKAMFFYMQFDETEGNPERNWAFSRVFTEGEEGTRLHEGMAYMTPLLRARQSQQYLRSEDKVLVSETMYDLSGRAVLNTLPAPMEWSGFSYHDNFAVYGVTDYDDDGTWKTPNPMGDGIGSSLPDNIVADEYYSDANPDKTIPHAKQYPYSRTRFYPDGRIAEIGGPGQTFRIGGGSGGASRAIRILYGGASEDELLAMFGDEAPAAASIRTVYRIDPNKGVSVEYLSKEGVTLATALIKATSNPHLDVTLPNEAVYDESSESVVEGAADGTDRVYTTKVAIVAPGETIDLRYTLVASMFEGCSDACQKCRYKVAVKVYNAEDPSLVHYDEVMDLNDIIGELCPPEAGNPGIELLTNGAPDNLPDIPSFTDVGTYTVEFRIITDQVDPADPLGRTFAEIATAEYRQTVSDQIQTDLLATINSYLDNDDPEGLYAWLDLYTNANPTDDTSEPLTVVALPNAENPESYTVSSDDPENCWTITIPRIECEDIPECDPDLFDFEAMLPAKWGQSAYNYVDANGNATGRHFPNNAWEYFYYKGNHLSSSGSYPNGAGAFNALVQNMVDDGYSCNELLRAWGAVVASYPRMATTDGSGDPAKLDQQVNLIEEFLSIVGKQYEGVSDCQYGTCGNGTGAKKGYIEYAHRFFEFPLDGSGNPDPSEDCVAEVGYTVGWNSDPDARDDEFVDTDFSATNDKKWEKLYNCQIGKNKKPRGVKDIFANCHCEGVDENSSTAEKNACILSMRDQVEDQCRSVCEMRADGFREEIVRMLHEMNWVIIGEDDGIVGVAAVTRMEVECMVAAMVNECESKCELTELKEYPGDVNLITGIGTPQQIENFEKVFSWRLRAEIYDGIGCTSPAQYESLNHAPMSETHDAVVEAMNRRLRQYREETGDAYSGKYNSDRLQEYFIDLVGPYPITEPNWADWNTTDPEPRTLGDGECPDDIQPYIFEFGANIRAEFVVAYDAPNNRHYFAIRSWCEKDGVEYMQEVDLTEGVWWDSCGAELCLAWEEMEPPEDVREVRPLTCEEMLARRLRSTIDQNIDNVLNQLTADYQLNYAQTCLDPNVIEDDLLLTQSRSLYHFTLYYYDRAGNLVQTVPPAGVRLVPASTGGVRFRNSHPNHELLTTYEYNSLGQLASTSSPDGGLITFIYDDAERLRLSQDAVQYGSAQYLYQRYDYLGRVIEVGQCDQPSYSDEDGDSDVDAEDLRLALINAANDSNFPLIGTQRTFTRYTYPDLVTTPAYNGEDIDGTPQRYTLNRIAHVYTDDGVHTQYSYDPHGNTEWLQQELPGLGANWIRYEYDVIGGNTQGIYYNEGWQDGFKHNLKYDKDNRLIEVRTSRDGVIWESDSRYDYYLHGPVRRTEYGEDSVQGRDYVFTLQGWMKAVNHPSLDGTSYALDPGQDGNSGNSHPGVAYDAFAMMMEYYQGDFDRANSFFSSTGGPGTAFRYHLHPTKDLYNGNIGSWTSNFKKVNDPLVPIQYDGQLTGFQYEYDVLNRIRLANFKEFNGTNYVETTPAGKYDVSYTYDPNGNITTLTRAGSVGNMDQLTYEYYPNARANQLRRVRDLVPLGTYTVDIDDQDHGTAPPNDPLNDYYKYDATGNLIEDKQEGTTIQWNIHGKVVQVTKANSEVLKYTYDASGNRVVKELITGAGTTKTYYVYDGGGIVLAIYEEICEIVVVTHPDMDHDGIPDFQDNCPTVFNPDQTDRNGTGGWGTPNGTGDACESDWDGDGLLNWQDNCPYIWDPSNTCNLPDKDGDGVPNFADNCPCMYNPTQENTDGDPPGSCFPWNTTGGDACDPDLDNDGIPNDHDNCPWIPNPDQNPGDPGDPKGQACEEGPGGLCTRRVEWLIYGHDFEGRIAVVKPLDVTRPMGSDRGAILDVDPDPPMLGGNIIGVAVTRILNEKIYEMKDHLGNTRVMISDLKISTDKAGSPGTAQAGQAPFMVKLHAVNNYDPFGMLQPERHWSTPDYRYGFNGKEMDNDWNDRSGTGIGTGNVYDYGFRIYDPRLGRFLSTDPLAPSYPWYTPYQFAGNSPIVAIDVDGAEPDHYHIYYRIVMGADGKAYLRAEKAVITGWIDTNWEGMPTGKKLPNHHTLLAQVVSNGKVYNFELNFGVYKGQIDDIVDNINNPTSEWVALLAEVMPGADVAGVIDPNASTASRVEAGGWLLFSVAGGGVVKALTKLGSKAIKGIVKFIAKHGDEAVFTFRKGNEVMEKTYKQIWGLKNHSLRGSFIEHIVAVTRYGAKFLQTPHSFKAIDFWGHGLGVSHKTTKAGSEYAVDHLVKNVEELSAIRKAGQVDGLVISDVRLDITVPPDWKGWYDWKNVLNPVFEKAKELGVRVHIYDTIDGDPIKVFSNPLNPTK